MFCTAHRTLIGYLTWLQLYLNTSSCKDITKQQSMSEIDPHGEANGGCSSPATYVLKMHYTVYHLGQLALYPGHLTHQRHLQRAHPMPSHVAW